MTVKKNKTLETIVTSLARKIKDPAQRTISVIYESDALKAARQSEIKLRQVYIEALGAGIWPVRYMRNAASLSAEEQLKLARSCVAVIGAGGLGGNVLMLLARMGIGMINIADPDVFSESNLNRQLAAATETLGINKTEAVKNMLFSVNPAVEVQTFPIRLTMENAPDILAGANAAVDALDNVPARQILADACKKTGIPMVHAAIAGFEGQAMTIFPGDHGLEMIYGKGSQTSSENAPPPEAIMGVPGVTPAILAGLESMEVIKILLGRGHSLKNRMLYVDLENAGFQEFSFDTDPDQT
ncbi:MAG: HesA/MoeB/ThiF family protein [Desulfobacteraceae bacterium]|nr:HesA/MoeB/ThiF family protein [Desulfobacteraceae bacterium]